MNVQAIDRQIRHRLAVLRHADEISHCHDRPHKGLGEQIPYERMKEKTNSTNPNIVVSVVGQFQKSGPIHS